MSKRFYKITILILACLVVWFACKYYSLRGQVLTAGFISWQAFHLQLSLDSVDSKAVRSGMSARDQVLMSLDWYLDYYKNHTNALVGSGLLGFVERERKDMVKDTIAYLRSTSTNDWGDDPYRWLEKEK